MEKKLLEKEMKSIQHGRLYIQDTNEYVISPDNILITSHHVRWVIRKVHIIKRPQSMDSKRKCLESDAH